MARHLFTAISNLITLWWVMEKNQVKYTWSISDSQRSTQGIVFISLTRITKISREPPGLLLSTLILESNREGETISKELLTFCSILSKELFLGKTWRLTPRKKSTRRLWRKSYRYRLTDFAKAWLMSLDSSSYTVEPYNLRRSQIMQCWRTFSKRRWGDKDTTLITTTVGPTGQIVDR